MSQTPDSALRNRRLLLASALAGVAGLSLLVSACGASQGSQVAQLGSTTTSKLSTSTSSTTSAASPQQQALAFSQCMRSHGVPNFPDPDSQGRFPPQSSVSAQAKQASLAAQEACKHLVSSGGGAGTAQDRQEKFAFALKVAGCLRTHGYPSFPDPTASTRGTSQSLSGAGIDSNSPRFQTAETTCEEQARKALGLP